MQKAPLPDALKPVRSVLRRGKGLSQEGLLYAWASRTDDIISPHFSMSRAGTVSGGERQLYRGICGDRGRSQEMQLE